MFQKGFFYFSLFFLLFFGRPILSQGFLEPTVLLNLILEGNQITGRTIAMIAADVNNKGDWAVISAGGLYYNGVKLEIKALKGKPKERPVSIALNEEGQLLIAVAGLGAFLSLDSDRGEFSRILEGTEVTGRIAVDFEGTYMVVASDAGAYLGKVRTDRTESELVDIGRVLEANEIKAPADETSVFRFFQLNPGAQTISASINKTGQAIVISKAGLYEYGKGKEERKMVFSDLTSFHNKTCFFSDINSRGEYIVGTNHGVYGKDLGEDFKELSLEGKPANGTYCQMSVSIAEDGTTFVVNDDGIYVDTKKIKKQYNWDYENFFRFSNRIIGDMNNQKQIIVASINGAFLAIPSPREGEYEIIKVADRVSKERMIVVLSEEHYIVATSGKAFYGELAELFMEESWLLK